MTPLHPTNLIAVPVPEDAHDFEKYDKETSPLAIIYLQNDVSLNFEMPKIIQMTFDFEILGTATKDTIDFDASPYFDNTNCKDKSRFLHDSFRSLLTANDALFENPYGDNRSLYEASEDALNQWQTAQSKVNSKYVILNKL